MRKILVTICAFSILIGCVSETKNNEKTAFRIPGEFEAQEAIWLGYRSARERKYFENDGLKILKALNPYIKVNLIVEGEDLFLEGKQMFEEMGLDTTKIEIFYQKPTDAWYRDMGPIFGILNGSELAMANFGFKDKDLDSVRTDIANRMGLKSISSSLVMDGGSFETNGQGILILCETVTLKQNPDWSKEEIETELITKFGIEKIIWIPFGLVDDPDGVNQIYESYYGRGVNGHTDEVVRFVNDSTLMLTWVTQKEAQHHGIDSINFNRLNKIYNILDSTLQNMEKNFKIIKVPHPNPDPFQMVVDSTKFRFGVPYSMFNKKLGLKHGDTINWTGARSYMNFVISNKVVLIPQFWEAGKPMALKAEDSIAKEVFKSVYPKRDIIGIPLNELKWVGGGMHCRYQSQPKLD